MSKRIPWFRFYCGRDWMRGGGWVLFFSAFPAPDLMTRGEEGMLTLSAVAVTVLIDFRFRPAVRVSSYSDFEEITWRRAGNFSGAIQ